MSCDVVPSSQLRVRGCWGAPVWCTRDIPTPRHASCFGATRMCRITSLAHSLPARPPGRSPPLTTIHFTCLDLRIASNSSTCSRPDWRRQRACQPCYAASQRPAARTCVHNRPLFMPGATVSDNEVASSDVLQVTNDEWIGWPGKRRCYTTCRDHNYVRYAG